MTLRAAVSHSSGGKSLYKSQFSHPPRAIPLLSSAGMCEYLINIDIQGAAEQCEDDDYVELLKELKLEHTFHALSSLRKILSKLEEGKMQTKV